MMHILVICLEDLFFFFFFDLLAFLGRLRRPLLARVFKRSEAAHGVGSLHGSLLWCCQSIIAAEDVLKSHLLSMESSSSAGGDGSAGSRWWFSSPEWCRGACFENGRVGVDKPLGVALAVGVGDGPTNTVPCSRAMYCAA